MSVGSELGEDPPGVDLVLPCSTVVLTDILVLPTDGANYKDTILLAQSLLVKSWSRKSHIMNFL